MWLNFVFITFFYYSSLLKCYLTHFSPMHLSSNVFLVWRKGALGNKWVNSLFSKDSIKAINKNYLKSSLFKVNNGSTRIMCEICSELTIRHQRGVMGVVLSSLLITLNRFYSLFWCFHCWTSNADWGNSFSCIHVSPFRSMDFSIWETTSHDVNKLFTNLQKYLQIVTVNHCMSFVNKRFRSAIKTS